MKIVSFRSRFDKSWFVLAVVLTVFAAPHPAAAQSWALGLGGMMCSIARNLEPFGKLFASLAYIMGAIMIGMGLSQLAYFTDTFTANKQFGIARPKGLLIAGACLLALPAFLSWATHTLYGGNSVDGLHACVAIPGIFAGGPLGLDGLLMNLVLNIQGPLVWLMSALSFVMGMFMIMRGLVKGSKFGQDAKSSIPNIFANLIIGCILFTIGTSMDAIVNTVFGGGAGIGNAVLKGALGLSLAAQLPGSGQFTLAVYAALTFVELIGVIAFVRGWIIIRDAVEAPGQKTVAQGLIHIIAGACAINIYSFVHAMNTTFGTTFLI